MAHYRLLFVGGRDNLQKIYDDCDDSSSETKAEIAFNADWISDYDCLSDKDKEIGRTTDDFTKSNEALYQQIMDGQWAYCYDIRNPKKYGDFACLNCPDFEDYAWNEDWEARIKRNKQRTIEAIKKLPSDTLFHFADSHW